MEASVSFVYVFDVVWEKILSAWYCCCEVEISYHKSQVKACKRPNGLITVMAFIKFINIPFRWDLNDPT